MYYIFALSTLALSLAIVFITVMRFHCMVCKRSHLKYTFVLVAALAVGLQPYFSVQLAGFSNVLALFSLFWLLVDGSLSVKEHAKTHMRRCIDDA